MRLSRGISFARFIGTNTREQFGIRDELVDSSNSCDALYVVEVRSERNGWDIWCILWSVTGNVPCVNSHGCETVSWASDIRSVGSSKWSSPDLFLYAILSQAHPMTTFLYVFRWNACENSENKWDWGDKSFLVTFTEKMIDIKPLRPFLAYRGKCFGWLLGVDAIPFC